MNEDALIGTVVELVNDVLPIYRYLAWSDDNDHCKLRESMKKTEQTKKKEQLATLKPGDRVTILSGLFAGRPGYLAEVSASGKAKVMVGPVSVSVDAKDLKSM